MSFQEILQQAQKEKCQRIRQALDRNEVPLDLKGLVSLVKTRASAKGHNHTFSDVDIARGAYFEEGPATDFCERLL